MRESTANDLVKIGRDQDNKPVPTLHLLDTCENVALSITGNNVDQFQEFVDLWNTTAITRTATFSRTAFPDPDAVADHMESGMLRSKINAMEFAAKRIRACVDNEYQGVKFSDSNHIRVRTADSDTDEKLVLIVEGRDDPFHQGARFAKSVGLLTKMAPIRHLIVPDEEVQLQWEEQRNKELLALACENALIHIRRSRDWLVTDLEGRGHTHSSSIIKIPDAETPVFK